MTELARVLAGVFLLAGLARAQEGGAEKKAAPTVVRRYASNMADEDWSFLKNRALWSDRWDPLKYIALPRPDWYMTLSGEVRISPQGLRIRGDEEQPSTVDNYLLQRYLLALDLHMGRRFRVFTELQSGILNGRVGSPRPNDQDLLELHQAFFEYVSPKESKRRLLLRLGRQELNIASGRLIAPSQGLNVKRSFDGLMTSFDAGNWMVEGGVARLVRIRPGIFDDPPDAEQDFWGVNVVRRKSWLKSGRLDLYYLGLSKKVAVYAQGIGQDRRHTVGGRLSGRLGRFDYNYDLIGQWGEFRGAPARAWAVSTDTGMGVKLGKLRGRLGVTANSASGDKDPGEASLQSFNPLFPGNSYSGIVGLLGPTNLTDITLSLRLPVLRSLVLAFEVPSYFRSSTRDGVYGIDLRLLLRGQANRERHVGTNPGVIASWQATRHVNVTGAVTRFLSGKFLKDTFAENGFGFYSIAATYRF